MWWGLHWFQRVDSRVQDFGIATLCLSWVLNLHPNGLWYAFWRNLVHFGSSNAYFGLYNFWFPALSFIEYRWNSVFSVPFTMQESQLIGWWLVLRTFTSYSRWTLMKTVPRILYVIYVRIRADKKRYLQTYFAVKGNYILIAIRGCTNVQCYLKSKISIDLC